MATCRRCGIEVSGINSLISFNKASGRCKSCDAAVRQKLISFRETFLHLTHDGIFTPEKWNNLYGQYLSGSAGGVTDGLNKGEALEYICADVLHFLDRMLSNATFRRPLTDEVEKHMYQLLGLFAIPNAQAGQILRRLTILNIYRGNFPVIPLQWLQSIHLDSDESCYMFTSASYIKESASSRKSIIQGNLVVTNKKLRFLSATGGLEVGWNTIMRIEQRQRQETVTVKGKNLLLTMRGIYLELTKKSGNGFYDVPDPEMAIAIIETLVRIAKRQIVQADDNNSRHIPQDVKIVVWQRDHGKCVQCGAGDYLEFDHIIPFSKGGASTVGNVQLLCRRCNLAKRDQI